MPSNEDNRRITTQYIKQEIKPNDINHYVKTNILFHRTFLNQIIYLQFYRFKP